MKAATMTTLDAAKAYLHQGWSVIPLRPRDKKPLIPWKEFQTRYATENERAEWFVGTNNNIGLVAGNISNLTIVDCDSPEAIEFFERECVERGESVETYVVQTAKGRHYYFQFVPGSNNFQSKKEWPGIDLRSEGGYVVAPPSIHPSGKPYTVLHDRPLGIAPSWLFEQATPVHTNGNGAAPDEDFFAPCAEGGRNMALTRLAGSLLQKVSLTEALKICRLWNQLNSVPLPDEELVRTVESVANKEAKKTDGAAIPTSPWPELDDAALHGLAGEIVNAIAPYTEADAVTLLVHLLSEFSCLIGRDPHIRLDGDYCPLSFWPVVVGDTSKSRKGSGSKRIKRLFQAADSTWTRGKHSGSLSSGEGLIYAVRDAEIENNKKGEEVVKDEGIEDKRLYLVQAEFGSMLRIMGRDGNSLSGHIREAWDGDTLRPMTKGHRICATNPHIGICGHVTQAELLRNLDNTEMANGFGNRFVWFCVKRSKFLPFAEDPPANTMKMVTDKLREAVKRGKQAAEIGMTKKAKDWWCKGYEELSQGTPGLAGSLLDRAEAQVRRIAALYALLDLKKDVDENHLFAALALWRHAEASVKYIFGDKIGDHVADTMYAAILQRGPLSDTDISSLFSGNISSSRLSQAKELLQSQGKIMSRSESTSKRPKNIWEAERN